MRGDGIRLIRILSLSSFVLFFCLPLPELELVHGRLLPVVASRLVQTIDRALALRP